MYPSNFVLQKYFNFDNSSFTSNLNSLGFKVFENPRSNYTRTLLSLTATLNMEYLQNDDSLGGNLIKKEFLTSGVINGEVQTFFKDIGYDFFWFEGGYLPGKAHYAENEKFITINDHPFRSTGTIDNDLVIYFKNSSMLSLISERIYFLATEIF
jgi:hypothetical protein